MFSLLDKVIEAVRLVVITDRWMFSGSVSTNSWVVVPESIHMV